MALPVTSQHGPLRPSSTSKGDQDESDTAWHLPHDLKSCRRGLCNSRADSGGADLPEEWNRENLYPASVFTCLIGLPIFRHGAIGPPHILGVVTVAAFTVAAAGKTGAFGHFSAYVETTSYSLTVFFLGVSTVIERLTRVPPSLLRAWTIKISVPEAAVGAVALSLDVTGARGQGTSGSGSEAA